MPNHEGKSGVLAIRPGEYREYINLREVPTSPVISPGDDVFAVCLLTCPLPPEPRNPKAEGFTVIAAFRSPDGQWGWIDIEKDTKTLFCEDMVDEFRCVPGAWYWLILTTER